MIKYKKPMPEVNSSKLEFIRWRFNEIGITQENVSELAYQEQKGYLPDVPISEYEDAFNSVLEKREIQHMLITGFNLDVLAEQGQLLGPLQAVVSEDRGTYGVDETLIQTAQLYGTISVSNAYMLDKTKPGIIGKLNEKGPYCNTFADDMVCVLVGCIVGKVAHDNDPGHEYPIAELEKGEDV